MKTEKRTWEFINNACLNIFSYKPINDEQAKVMGCGKIWNDRVKAGDTIIVKTKKGKGELIVVDDIFFTDNLFEATVTLGEEIQ